MIESEVWSKSQPVTSDSSKRTESRSATQHYDTLH